MDRSKSMMHIRKTENTKRQQYQELYIQESANKKSEESSKKMITMMKQRIKKMTNTSSYASSNLNQDMVAFARAGIYYSINTENSNIYESFWDFTQNNIEYK